VAQQVVRNPTKAEISQVKGAIFEAIIRNLLINSNFKPLTADGKQVRHSFFNIRGRGCWHNIDASGQYDVAIPYVYPIRLLAEAKCYEDNIDLPILQSFVGVVKDISENYFVKEKISSDERRKFRRYIDCGALFSSSDFTDEAQNFALAHGISLVSYKNNPIMTRAVDAMNRVVPTLDVVYCAKNKKAFSNYLDDRLPEPPKRMSNNHFVQRDLFGSFLAEFKSLSESVGVIKTSLIGTAISKEKEFRYPIHLLSKEEFPNDNFLDTDTVELVPQYEATENGLVFRIDLAHKEDTRRVAHLYFSIPSSIYVDYFSSRQIARGKVAFMNEVEIPMPINKMRRVIRLKIKKEFVERYA
jgi:hypothetical protein